MTRQYNHKNKNGSWTLCSEYLKYRAEGGSLGPETWNAIKREGEK